MGAARTTRLAIASVVLASTLVLPSCALLRAFGIGGTGGAAAVPPPPSYTPPLIPGGVPIFTAGSARVDVRAPAVVSVNFAVLTHGEANATGTLAFEWRGIGDNVLRIEGVRPPAGSDGVQHPKVVVLSIPGVPTVHATALRGECSVRFARATGAEVDGRMACRDVPTASAGVVDFDVTFSAR